MDNKKVVKFSLVDETYEIAVAKEHTDTILQLLESSSKTESGLLWSLKEAPDFIRECNTRGTYGRMILLKSAPKMSLNYWFPSPHYLKDRYLIMVNGIQEGMITVFYTTDNFFSCDANKPDHNA